MNALKRQLFVAFSNGFRTGFEWVLNGFRTGFERVRVRTGTGTGSNGLKDDFFNGFERV